MKTIILLLRIIPTISLSQKTDVFVKLTDAKGVQIMGEATLKGFERWIGATTISSGGKNNTELSFTMAVSGVSSDLKRALANGELLLNGQVTVLSPNPTTGYPVTSYTIKMETIAVTFCSEAMGCNNVMTTSVNLRATRIGWTYYQIGKAGAQTISKKFGWDADTQSEWTNF
ncbi:MAG TPA: type VI secretion system tube protein Hcp [Cyclobacteriaceae bacterium]|nr:type VI secretion system tube protein Hcp [Cyclobacteriaceae bacterium]